MEAIGSFGQQAVGGETGGMFEAGAKTGPETASGDYLVVGGTAVVVGTYGASCGKVALTHDERGDKE